MMEAIVLDDNREMAALCESVRALFAREEYTQCRTIIAQAMGMHPNAAQPHNLFGVLLEKLGEQRMAMNHFRAAWALDPTFVPARRNLEQYGSFSGETDTYYISQEDCDRKGRRRL